MYLYRMTFWEHLEELRGTLLRILLAVLAAAVVAFCFKDPLFSVVLAPISSDFITYRLFSAIAGTNFSLDEVGLINVELAQQFLTHMKVALWAGFLLVSPYVLYRLFRFVSPALYQNERRYAVGAVVGGYLMFVAGVLLNYFIIFPLAFRFLVSYQVSPDVVNMITLDSYISNLLMLCFLMGVFFELPVVCWLLAKVGLLKASAMARYRRHAIVLILVIAAIITPTADALTLTIVALPIYLLYEISLLIVRRTS